jgi:hypothetical protein
MCGPTDCRVLTCIDLNVLGATVELALGMPPSLSGKPVLMTPSAGAAVVVDKKARKERPSHIYA